MSEENSDHPDPVEAIAELTELLHAEIAAIEARDFDRVTGYLPRKSALLEALEARRSDIESGEVTVSPEDLEKLQQLIRKNAELLARMGQASGDLVREITR
ncbi:hypothetical protein LCGC14_2944520, partial [marine sediment metagenome]